MSEESIFSQTETDTISENPQPQIQLPPEALDFVGEGKKYKSVDDALRSIPHAQSHIQKLEEEMKAMREELQRRKTAEDLLQEFKAPSEPVQQPQLDANTLAALVDQTLEQREARRRQQDNISSVVNAFNEKYGESAPQVYEKIAKDNGLSIQFLNSVAATSPAAVLNLAGLMKQPEATPGKTTSSVNTAALSSNQQPHQLSAKLPKGATTKDLVSAWRAAGEMVKQDLGKN